MLRAAKLIVSAAELVRVHVLGVDEAMRATVAGSCSFVRNEQAESVDAMSGEMVVVGKREDRLEDALFGLGDHSNFDFQGLDPNATPKEVCKLLVLDDCL